jgi:GH25 family lysozyme M1 (1,4-beta-N-acetylmuramidase)
MIEQQTIFLVYRTNKGYDDQLIITFTNESDAEAWIARQPKKPLTSYFVEDVVAWGSLEALAKAGVED